MREGERLRNKTDTVSITVGSADFLFQKKNNKVMMMRMAFFFFFIVIAGKWIRI